MNFPWLFLWTFLKLVPLSESEFADQGVFISPYDHKGFFVTDEVERLLKIEADAPIIQMDQIDSDCIDSRKDLTVMYTNEINKLYSEWLDI